MKKEDITFLKELQNELNTQPDDGQADPRFWMIVEQSDEICPEGYEDGVKIYDSDGGESYSVDDFIKVVEESYMFDIVDKEIRDIWEKLDKKDEYELCEFCNTSLNMNVEAIPYRTIHKISEGTGAFLTKRACQRHIDSNGYHYNKPQTYSMTAWRNPEFERVLNILKTMDINDIKEDE